MNNKTFRIEKILPKSILSRDAVREILENEIKKFSAQTVEMDFSNIEFISRSAAHELLKMKERFEYSQTNKKEIIFKELAPSPAEMIRMVAATSAYPSNIKEEFNPKRVNIKDLVST